MLLVRTRVTTSLRQVMSGMNSTVPNKTVRVPHVRASVRGPIMNSSNAFSKRVKTLDGLRPSSSAHVRWREHGAPGLVPLGGRRVHLDGLRYGRIFGLVVELR